MDPNDKLYQEGLRHYVEALYAARQFESLIVSVIASVLDDNRTKKLTAALGLDKLHGGGPYIKSPKEDNIALDSWWGWIAQQYWLDKPKSGVHFYVGLIFKGNENSAVLALGSMRSSVGKVLRKEMKDLANWNGFELTIEEPLRDDDSLNKFRQTLVEIIDNKFLPFLEKKNFQVQGWFSKIE